MMGIKYKLFDIYIILYIYIYTHTPREEFYMNKKSKTHSQKKKSITI